MVGLSRHIRFVSYSVMLGFLSGVACNMVLGQPADLVGVPADGSIALTKAWNVVTGLGASDPASVAAGVGALVILIVLGRTRLTVFSSLVALAVPTLLVIVTGASSVARGERHGSDPARPPTPPHPRLRRAEPRSHRRAPPPSLRSSSSRVPGTAAGCTCPVSTPRSSPPGRPTGRWPGSETFTSNLPPT